MPVRHRTRSEREQLDLFRALPGDLAPRNAQDLMAYPFFSLAKSHRTTPIDFRMNDIAIRVEAVPEHGMATIWDADVLIWAASRIVEARDAGLRTSRLMAATPYEILTFIGRGMAEEPETDVAPDPRTPNITENPAHILEITRTHARPPGSELSVELDGDFYALRPESGYQWNRKAFSLLYQLFQMSVAPVDKSGPAITISK